MKASLELGLIFCLSLLSCSGSINHSDNKNDLTRYGFNGKVKSVRAKPFDLIVEKDTFKIGNEINSASFNRNSLFEFNELGNLTSKKEFLYTGKVINEEIYTYNKSGLLIKRKEINNYGRGSYNDNVFVYDSKDSIVEWTISNDSFKRVYKFYRDNRHRPIKKEAVENDSIVTSFSVEYDNFNNVITENQYKSGNNPVKLLTRKFNSKNLKIREKIIEYGTWDTLNYENVFIYDDKQNLMMEKSTIENDSTYDEIKYDYHNNGELKEIKTTPKGADYFVITTQKFNEYGDLTEHSYLPSNDKPREIWIYNYKYDSHNNWIEKTEFKDGKPLRIIKRTIDYYN
jgi:phage antirepressor YoqD-like protein